MTGVTGEAGGLTFGAYAARIGKSRPYVSKLVALGRIHGPALTAERRILPDIADRQIAESADPAHQASHALAAPAGAEATYAKERALKTQVERERAELELRVRRGQLVARGEIAAVLGPWVRELRDTICGIPRDHVLDPVQAADCEAAMARALTTFSERLARLGQERMDDGDAAAGE